MKHAGILVSFNMASNRPGQFSGFLDNIQDTADDPRRLEVLVKIDDEDEEMHRAVAREQTARPFAVKFLSSPRGRGYFELYKGLNKLHALCDPTAYFVCNLNDEIRFETKGWDTVLDGFVGFYPDHIFRLATSHSRFRNYGDLWECGYAPENYPFATKKWIDIQGDWCPCHGPDGYQQYVSFWLTRATWPDKNQYKRDVAIWDFRLSGQALYDLMTEEQMWLRVQRGWKTWFRLNSYSMQTEASRRAHKLLAYIRAHERGLAAFTVVVGAPWTIKLRNQAGKVEEAFFYGLNPFPIVARNLIRRWNKYRHCGGGPPPFHFTRLAIFLRRLIGWPRVPESRP